MSNPDQTQRFLFDDTPLRGEITGLQQSYREVLDKHDYPEPVRHLLGQFMAAVALLSDTLKFEGTLSLQVRGAGQVRMLMAECRDHEALRAIAQYTDDFSTSGPLLSGGQMAITIEPKQGKRYQGIVPLSDDHSLAQALESYFQQSEQIRTRVWLEADDQRAAGMMIQAMPTSASEGSLETHDHDAWDRVTHLADTLTQDELLGLDNETVLHRLFHEEQVRLFAERPLRFECTCSRERCGEAILTLGHEEANQVVAEEGAIISDCQFCHQQYRFDQSDVDALFDEQRQRLQ